MNSPWQWSLLCFCFGNGEWLRPPWDKAAFHCPRETAAKLLSPAHQYAEYRKAFQLYKAMCTSALRRRAAPFPHADPATYQGPASSRVYQGSKGKGRRQMTWHSCQCLPSKLELCGSGLPGESGQKTFRVNFFSRCMWWLLF